MPRKMSLDELRRRFKSESRCRRFLETVIWKDGRFCPHCGSLKSWKLRGRSCRPGLYECSDCSRQFTVTVKTPFHSTKLPLWKWFHLIYRMLTSSAGTSSLKLAAEVGVSQKTAWKMMHAIREMMDLRDEIGPALKGIVEVDEKYVGGKPRKRKGVINKRGKGTKKSPVLVIVQRRGPVRIYPIAKDSFNIIAPLVRRHVRPGAQLMTDQHAVYQKLAPEFAGHSFVKHNKGEFARGIVHNNTAESVNAILEKANKGVYHWWSSKHLHRYLNEIAFRWNQRKPVKRKRFRGKAMKEYIEMAPLPFMVMLRNLLKRAPTRQTRRTPNNGLVPIVREVYHWQSMRLAPL